MTNKILLPLILLTFSFLLLVGACEKDRKGDPIELFVKNNSNDTIIACLQFNYPDTILLDFKKERSMTDAYGVNPYSKVGFLEFTGWERTLRKEKKTEGVVCIVYSVDTFRNYPFEQIQNDYNILKRYIVSIDQLKAMKWTITYP